MTSQELDQRPGCLPDIRTNHDSITFRIPLAGISRGGRMVIRCDADGEIWISIDHGGTDAPHD